MKKIGLIFGALGALAVLLLVLSSRQGSPIATGDARLLEQKTLQFLEDIKFKDFQKAASYHSREDRKRVDIPPLIERLFAVKPEFLDILRYEVQKVEIDSSGKRAKVKTRTVIKVLNTSEIKEPEVIFYWYKDPAEGWCMQLESSLH